MNRIPAAAICLLVFAKTVHAAEYPARPVRIVVPFPPGGTSDILTRIIGEKLSAGLSQQMVIDNRSGAGGVVASEIVAKATPDGYTVLMTFISHSINPHVYVKLPYDTDQDFVPIALFAISPNVVVVTPSLPIKSVKDLIAYAKARPGKVNFASAGIGTNSHLSGEMMNAMAGIDMVHIAYKGAPQANADVANGSVQLHIPSMPVAMPLIQAGRLKAIAVTSTKRSPALPDLPTVAETLPGYESLAWYGFTAACAVPRGAVKRFSGEVEKALKAPDLIESFSRQGAEPTYMNPEQFANYIRSDLKRWGETVKAAGLKPGKL
jgi:tripartite-type tricarboxylate transporter receptor subunit TctC